jgi:hypothetical protein
MVRWIANKRERKTQIINREIENWNNEIKIINGKT